MSLRKFLNAFACTETPRPSVLYLAKSLMEDWERLRRATLVEPIAMATCCNQQATVRQDLVMGEQRESAVDGLPRAHTKTVSMPWEREG
jgi:hypothetical protein